MSIVVVFVLLLAAILIFASRLPGPVDIRELSYRSPTEAAQSTFMKIDWWKIEWGPYHGGDAETELMEIELGYRAAFALFHADDVMFGGWF